jgi:hypothetical protein
MQFVELADGHAVIKLDTQGVLDLHTACDMAAEGYAKGAPERSQVFTYMAAAFDAAAAALDPNHKLNGASN